MADDNNSVQFELDLDNADFLEKGLQAQNVIEKIGSADSLKGLIEGLTQTTAILGTIGAVAFSFKEALDLTIEAEQLQKVNDQFELLTKQAGISADALKNGLEEASGGLIATNDLLIAANKALVTMGSSAEALPELMELARKASTVFGTEALDTFNQLSMAIAGGNTRVLKHMGIIIDTNKAYQNFANQQGIAINSLNAAGKSQAILNAVLEQGDKTFGDMNIKTGTATQLMGALKVTVTEMSEVFTKAFEKTIGPTVRSALASLVELADTMKTKVTASFGDGAAQSAAKIKLVEQQIISTKQALVDLQTKNSVIGTILPGLKTGAIAAANAKLIELGKQLTVLKSNNDAITASEKAKGLTEKENAISAVKNFEDEKVRQENNIKYEKDIINLDKEKQKALTQSANSLAQVEKTVNAQKENYYKEYSAKYLAITKSTYLDSTQKMNEIEKLDQTYKEAEQQRTFELLKVRADSMSYYVKNSEDAFDGLTRAAQEMAAKAKQEMEDFGKQGQQVMANFQNYSTQAFDQIGSAIASGKDVAKATADAMLGFFLNMIASYAGQWGTVLLSVGIGTANPIAIAEGSGLLLLSGIIKAIAGSLGATSSVSTPSASVGASSPSSGGISVGSSSPISVQQAGNTPIQTTSTGQTPAVDTALPISTPQGDAIPVVPITDPNAAAATSLTQSLPQRTVTINIAGNYFDTQSTQRTLMDLIRQETDATDFTYNKVGV